MKWFFIYLLSLYFLWHAIDLEANTLFASGIAPFAFFLVLVVFVLWLSTKVKARSTYGADGGGLFGGGGDSCGGGGGDGGGGGC